MNTNGKELEFMGDLANAKKSIGELLSGFCFKEEHQAEPCVYSWVQSDATVPYETIPLEERHIKVEASDTSEGGELLITLITPQGSEVIGRFPMQEALKLREALKEDEPDDNKVGAALRAAALRPYAEPAMTEAEREANKAAIKASGAARDTLEASLDQDKLQRLRKMDQLVVTMNDKKPIQWGKVLELQSNIDWTPEVVFEFEFDEYVSIGEAIDDLIDSVKRQRDHVSLIDSSGKKVYVFTSTGGVGEDTEGELRNYAASILLDESLYDGLGIASVEYSSN